MYWNSNPCTSVHLMLLLSKKDVTLQEIMDDEEVLQECKSQNKLLIDYLVRSDVLEKLVSLTTEEPSGDEEDTVKYKYPNIACELLTCEVPQLSESLANDESLLRKLFSFLDSDAPLNPLLASFFSKTLSVLITRKSEQNWYSYQINCLKVLEFLKLKENSITLLLKHLGTSAIMDLVFKLITVVEDSDLKDNILNWLDEQKLVENIVGLLDPQMDSDMHYNAAQLLCDVIKASRADKKQVLQPNKILDRIESPETVSLLLDFMLKDPKCDTSIVGGISVLLTLLENKSDLEDRDPYEETSERSFDYLKVVASTTEAILPRLKDFHDILINPPSKPAVKTTITVLEPPLGNTRVEVAKLLSVLVASNRKEINKKLAELDTINVLLDLFFKYTWNNFLHTQVEKCLAFALNFEIANGEGKETEKNILIDHILSKCRLIQRILEAWQDNEAQQNEHNRPRRGYMGHLIEIANNIVQLSETYSFGSMMKEIIDNETLVQWENFVSTKLVKIQEIYNTCLGESCPSSNDKNDGNGKEGSFENFFQGLCSNYYQLQALAPAFTGEFGSFQEDQFNDDEDVMSDAVNSNFQNMSFTVNEEETDQRAAFFEKVCAQKFQTLDDYDNYAWNQDSVPTKPSDVLKRDPQTSYKCNISDEDEMDSLKKKLSFSKDEEPLDYNMFFSWPSETDVPPAVSLNPWESSNKNTEASPDLGWANFESASFVANFDQINTTIASASAYDLNQASLEFTPSENNVGPGKSILPDSSTMEKPLMSESDESSIALSNLEIITKAADRVSLNPENKISTNDRGTKKDKDDENIEFLRNKDNPDILDGSIEKPEIIGDMNTVAKLNKEKEVTGDSRFFLGPEEVSLNNEKEPESGDINQLFNENVQVVPKEAVENCCKEAKNETQEEKSPNGPI